MIQVINNKFNKIMYNVFNYINNKYGTSGDNNFHYYTINKNYAKLLVENNICTFEQFGFGILYNNNYINVNESIEYGVLKFELIKGSPVYVKIKEEIELLTSDERNIRSIIK